MTVAQRRGRKIMMTPGELDEFLTAQRTCRVATVSADGAPHVSALWFLWDGRALWLYSVVRSRRWADLRRDPRVAIAVDTGEEYGELRGAELSGAVEVVGEVPRSGGLCAELDAVETLFARKYFGLDSLPHDGRHAWLRLVPEKIVSWDFRKLGAV
ncbi:MULTISPECIES: pyridoxamine 5'-phosphate oxidase family protein [Streptomyces]|uniref:Pyridoxamine 5-phosphate oxidase n=2 Tax=Streptomyces TaxID=1883 RepID=A0A2U9NX43_STRAS|nr:MULTISPECIES: pyridoxamine 5'-phosphate oxidase family protein [Streptomyces]AWT41847.1 pyridoxamine 5-phosphate oxidase [Streptomyces actuosus]MBM4825544.1 pyridoxamine 5'-phosphate oxidase family protein [Streptomyces actuosus]GHF58421.1 pyridoxamine 5'-phosphate oxidase [Streptomyces griseosporeus]